MVVNDAPELEDDALHQLLVDLPPAFFSVLVPCLILYASLYALARKWRLTSLLLSVPTLMGFWLSGIVAPVRCAASNALLRFTVAAASMKLLDVQLLSFTLSFPKYTPGIIPQPSVLALIYLTELRWESFAPNPIRQPPLPKIPFVSSPDKHRLFYSEPFQLFLHLAIFACLQSLPQLLPVKALGILFTIWLIWTGIQRFVRYKTSPPLFGPIWLADSLAGFWTETWHNAFASPCMTIAYLPTFSILSRLGAPKAAARAAAVVAGFGLMAAFHMYALEPLLSKEGMWRIGVFFVGNGILTVLEVALWGKKRHWCRRVLAWAAELAIASWTVSAIEVADGVLAADWRGLCSVPSAKR